MRLSKPRLLLRAALLLVLAGFMAWRAVETDRNAAAPGVEPEGARLLSRVATLEWILCGLAVLTAGAALFALRKQARTHSLHLGEPPPGGADAGEPPPDPGAR